MKEDNESKALVGATEEERSLLITKSIHELEKAKEIEKQMLSKGKLSKVKITNGYVLTTYPEKWRSIK